MSSPRPLIAFIKWAVGALLVQHPLGAVVAVGFATRWLGRVARRELWRRSPARTAGLELDDFLATLSPDQQATGWPNWLRTGGLAANWRMGWRATACLFLTFLPAMALWWLGWTLGWNLSFYKSYEQSAYGPLLCGTGLALFAGAMLYAPVGHVRHALSGDWRTYLDVRLNWRLARRAALRMWPAALLALASAGVVFVLRTAPYFVGGDPRWRDASAQELRAWLDGYYLAAGAVVWLTYLALWRTATKGVVAAFAQAGPALQILPAEREILTRLGLASQAPRAAEGRVGPIMRWGWRAARSATALAGLWLVWGAVGFQVFVAQFFNYIPVSGWFNHPLVVLPWIKYVPPGL